MIQKQPTRIKVIKNIKPSSGQQAQKKADGATPLLSENDYNDILNNVLKIKAIEPPPAQMNPIKQNNVQQSGVQQTDLLGLNSTIKSETQQLNEIFN